MVILIVLITYFPSRVLDRFHQLGISRISRWLFRSWQMSKGKWRESLAMLGAAFGAQMQDELQKLQSWI